MNVETIRNGAAVPAGRPSLRDRLARRAVFARLSSLRHGKLVLHDYDGTHQFGDGQSSLVADITIVSSRVYRRLLLDGTIGAGEGYMAGEWQTSELVDVVRVFVSNIDCIQRMDSRRPLLRWLSDKWQHFRRRNSLQGSRKNIAAHYDLSNDFYQLFLDPSMMYSAAVFPDQCSDLDTAAEYKLQRICELLRLQPSDHLLEIGTGWGGMAIYAAQHYGCRVTTTTISAEQYRYAVDKVKSLGLQNQIDVLFEDYRNLEGHYDKLVSIEMIEAVGHQYYRDYFSTINRLLKPDGLMAIQAITIPDQRYHRATRSVDFIQKYIFPGGCLPSIATMAQHIGRHSDMRIVRVDDIASHYAKTLASWRRRFLDNQYAVQKLGFTEQFQRMWEFYLAYCEGGFTERAIGTVQMVLEKPRGRADLLMLDNR